ncbi:Hypothetical_protein [Hexamita inflata]|uniref:Hypothetical_protein n=1 Tax=Hexamita inflata TaxID=28002 RepID=A0AA86P238_9EUKA|nr:Hypothetical protein HINF_LOCUS16614 [Hexamita inflata]
MYTTLPTYLNFKLTLKQTQRGCLGHANLQCMIINSVYQLKQQAISIAAKHKIQLQYPRLRLKQNKHQKQSDYALLTEFNCADLLSKTWVAGNYSDDAQFQIFVFTSEKPKFIIYQALQRLNELRGVEIILNKERFDKFKQSIQK